MKEQLDNWGKMAAFMHMTGRVPAAYADQPGKAIIARYRGRGQVPAMLTSLARPS